MLRVLLSSRIRRYIVLSAAIRRQILASKGLVATLVAGPIRIFHIIASSHLKLFFISLSLLMTDTGSVSPVAF